MTSREKVLSVYPSAFCDVWGGWRDGEMGSTVRRRQMTYEEKLRDHALGTGDSETEAWDDAASKLPPGSPAGETASAKPRASLPRFTCEHGTDSLASCPECIREACPASLAAVPEPMPTEGHKEPECSDCCDHEANIREWIRDLGGNVDVPHISVELERLIQGLAHPAAPKGDGWIAGSGVALIAAERKRQVESEGWTAEHDDSHHQGELAKAAEAYTVAAWAQTKRLDRVWLSYEAGRRWPWGTNEMPTLSNDPIRNLVKAGALIAAEIDRLQRLPAPVAKEGREP